MALFAVIYRYADQPEVIAEHRPAHRDFIVSLLEGGGLIASGRTEGGSGDSALLLFEAESAASIEAHLDRDPFWSLGVIDQREIVQWHLSSGSIGADAHGH